MRPKSPSPSRSGTAKREIPLPFILQTRTMPRLLDTWTRAGHTDMVLDVWTQTGCMDMGWAYGHRLDTWTQARHTGMGWTHGHGSGRVDMTGPTDMGWAHGHRLDTWTQTEHTEMGWAHKLGAVWPQGSVERSPAGPIPCAVAVCIADFQAFEVRPSHLPCSLKLWLLGWVPRPPPSGPSLVAAPSTRLYKLQL